MNWWNLGVSTVLFLVNLGLSIGAILFFFQKFLGPALVKQIGDELKTEFATAERALKTGMSAMSSKGVIMREVAEIEGLVSEGLLDQYPELQILLESVNPELYDKIMVKLRENPELIHILYDRWGHIIERRGAPREEKKPEKKYHRV